MAEHADSEIDSRHARENIHGSSARRMLVTFALTMLMLIMFNYCSALLLDYYSGNRGYRLIDEKWRLLMQTQEPVDLLIVGDSSCNQGVSPDVLQDEKFPRVLNLCTMGDALVLDDVWMLEYYFAHHSTLSAVVVVHAYDTWQRDRKPSVVAQVPLEWGFWNKLKPSIRLDTGESIEVFLARYVPMYAENLSMAKILKFPWRARRLDMGLNRSGFMENVTANPAGVISDSESHKRFTSANEFSLSDDNVSALDRLSRIASDRQLDVFIANAPMYAGLYEDPGLRNYMRDMNKSIRKHIVGNRRMHFIFAEPMLYSEFEMQNADHLATMTAPRYTKAISEQVRLIGQD